VEERHNCPYCKTTAVLKEEKGLHFLHCPKCGVRECKNKLIKKLRRED